MGRMILLMVAITALAVPCARSVGLNHGIVSGQALRPAQLDSAIRARMDLYKIPAVSAAIVLGDSIVWSRSYGFADVALTIPTTDTTIFKLASISKTFTASAFFNCGKTA
jgi:CubicO group peptidase (beta-lactamase class C family)